MKKFDALKWLCLLSLIGFIYCFVFDLGYFTLFIDTESNSSQSNSFLNIIIENLSDNGFVFDQYLSSQLKKLSPLILILIFLIAGALFLSHQINANTQRGMHIFMGLFFIVFSFFKFLDYKGFPDSFKRYDPLAKKIPGYAKMYPFIETVLGIAYLAELQLPLVLIITLVILSFTTVGVIQALHQKSEIECACLGTAIKLPMTEATLIENTIMLTMSSILLIDYFF